MDTYRQLQADKWRQRAGEPSREDTDPQLISSVVVDLSSIMSIRTFMKDSDGQIARTGILFGTIEEDGLAVIVDAIYECSQDTTTGEPLRDARLSMVTRISKLMGLRPVGILISSREANPSKITSASDIVRILRVEEAIAHVLLMISRVGPNYETKAVVLTPRAVWNFNRGTLREGVTLNGQTVNGGLDGSILQKPIEVVWRTVNTIIHNGFYRLNRPNHTPTLEDVRAFIMGRKEKANIDKMHLQLADYHLILFIADTLGEPTAERIILSIHREDDELVEDLVELLMTSSNTW